MKSNKPNPILDQTFDFALKIIDYSEKLREMHRYEMSSQIFRSGTSIGANIREAQSAESRADFIHKFKISAKEAEEVNYWLALCGSSNHYPTPEGLKEQLEGIIRLISKIISSAKKNG